MTQMDTDGFLFKEEGYQLLGACFEVYNEEGSGFLEDVYQEALEIELGLRDIPFDSRPELRITYKGHELRKRYIPDLVCFGAIIIELKAVKELCDEHRAQLLNYLKATGYKVGYLVNFGHHPKLQYERFVNTRNRR